MRPARAAGGHRLLIRWPQTALLGRATVLVIDRDVGNRRYVGRILRAAGYSVVGFADPNAARQVLAERQHDVVLLSLDPKQDDWLGVVRAWRAVNDAPLMVMAENGSPEAVAHVSDNGVDDCVVTPFDATELSARVARLLQLGWKRRGMATLGRVGDLQLDMVRPRARVSGRDVGLTKLEYRALWVLMQSLGGVLPFQDIETGVWGDAEKARRGALVRVVHNLRRKLTLGSSSSVQLLTVPRIGYRLHVIDRPPVPGNTEVQGVPACAARP